MKGLQVSGGDSLVSLINNLLKHHIALFSLYEFSLWVSHIKFLMMQYRHKTMSYHLFFLKRFLVDDIETYDTLYFFFMWVFPFWGFSYKIFNEPISTQDYVISSIFPKEIFGGWYWDIWYIVLFSLCEFFLFDVSHIKFLMSQCQHKVICYVI